MEVREADKAQIGRLYRRDTMLVCLSLILAWVVLGFVFGGVAGLAPDPVVEDMALAAGLTTGLFITAALIAVVIHLRKNRQVLYLTELVHPADVVSPLAE